MTELRDSVVEAMAQAIRGQVVISNQGRIFEATATAALDAALDVLGERQLEWYVAAGGMTVTPSRAPSTGASTPISAWLAVLRAGKGSE